MRKIRIASLVLAIIAVVSIVGFTVLALQNNQGGLEKQPITTDGSPTGDLLKKWWKEGTAAGNVGDYYDNRDGNHSPHDLKRFPQLTAIQYSAEEIKQGKNWANARVILPHVTFGNSSTASAAHAGGSNPRHYYVVPAGLAFLYNQYTKNNLYIYPEHRDHHPGHNGLYLPPDAPRTEGFGDLYPTNTPYLIISQGSSGSDQPFMNMMSFTLAAFRPEVKKKLSEKGLLMPTIQMLMRTTNKHLKDPKEYLTGKAHPSVFEGAWVDDLAMVKKAHALELKALPPMVQLRLVEEDKVVNGIDFFETAGTEALADTPACIARIHRSKAQKRRIVVDVSRSVDVNQSKLTCTWVILRGDPDKIKIVPKADDQSIVEITVAHHKRRPVAPGSALESNRVDIGVFVNNGAYYSAPGFVTFFTLDREARTYGDDGRILEFAHGMGETEMRVKNWVNVCSTLVKDENAKLFGLSAKQIAGLKTIAALQADHAKTVAEAEVKLRLLEHEEQTAKDPIAKERVKPLAEAERLRVIKLHQERDAFAARKLTDLAGESPRQFVEACLTKLTRDPRFAQTYGDWLKKQRTVANEGQFRYQWKRLADFGIAKDKEQLTPLFPGKTPGETKWTAFERCRLEYFASIMLADLLFPGMIEVIWHANYVDHRLSTPREWRDIHRYDSKGDLVGWTRYSAAGVQLFNYEGLLVIEKDALGRCAKGQAVRYLQDPWKGQGPNQNLLRALPVDAPVRYEFAGADDLRGRRVADATKEKK
jgi:hypothetical protein